MAPAWITAADALARLGVKPQSLYASVSRGRIRTRPDPADSRRSLYSREDVERLAGRGSGQRRSVEVAADAVRWGDPVMPSAISTIRDGRLYYRGEDAALLSRAATLEEAAALLWAGDWILPRHSQPAVVDLAGLFAALAARAPHDPPTLGRARSALVREAAEVFATVAGAGVPLHERLARHWGRPEASEVLRRALVLLADHELNASTFAARVAVSTGASLAAAVLAGLCTLSGPLHGNAASAVFALADHAEAAGADTAVRIWLGQGRPVPAFGHRLYPGGDIRTAELLAAFEVPPLYRELAAVCEALVGERANVDFALAAITAAFDLPRTAPIAIFALARIIGWLAHALEQSESGTLIRPRARYVGPAPKPADAGAAAPRAHGLMATS